MGCLICERIGQIERGENPYFVCALSTGYVVLGDHQRFEGYTLFLCKRHVTELYQLPWGFRTRFLQEMSLVAEAVAARAAGQLYAFLAVEGMSAVGADSWGVDWYYGQGVRLGMLTWNESNALAAGAGGDPQAGLTEAGRRAVRRMGELGMAVDVSHLNDGGFWDVVDLAAGPVIATHSNCRALCGVPRNLTDDQLRAIRDTGGVVGLNAFHGFVHDEPRQQTARTLALHAAHMAEVMGVEHVGCGFDFCAFMGPGNEGAEGLESAAHIQNLFYWLEQLGMSRQEREMIARDNFLRVLRQILDRKGNSQNRI